MTNYIDIDSFIESAKKKGVDFGKGDPYNRLRYYTKLGWLPHMIRKKDDSGNVVGHYPRWAIDRITLIEELKEKGLTNEDIEKRIEAQNKFQNFLNLFKTKETRNQIISWATLLLIVLIFTNELGIIRLGETKNPQEIAQTSELPNQILDSGTAFVPKEQKKIFIKNSMVRNNSKIYVNFTQDYSPAVRYWIQEIKEYDGFTVELDAPVFNNTEFNWWITQ